MESTPGIFRVRQRPELSSPSFRGVRLEPAFEVQSRESNPLRRALNSPLRRGCGVLTLCVLVRCEQATLSRRVRARVAGALFAHMCSIGMVCVCVRALAACGERAWRCWLSRHAPCRPMPAFSAHRPMWRVCFAFVVRMLYVGASVRGMGSDAQQHTHVAPISGSAHEMQSEGPVDHGLARGTQHAYVHG